MLDFLFILILLLFSYIFVYLRFVCDICFHLLFLDTDLFLTMPPSLPFLLFIISFSPSLNSIFYSTLCVIFEDILMDNQLLLLFQKFMLLIEYDSLHLSSSLILLLVLFLNLVLLSVLTLLNDLLLLLVLVLFSFVGYFVCLIFNLVFLDLRCNVNALDFFSFLLITFFLLHLFVIFPLLWNVNLILGFLQPFYIILLSLDEHCLFLAIFLKYF